MIQCLHHTQSQSTLQHLSSQSSCKCTSKPHADSHAALSIDRMCPAIIVPVICIAQVSLHLPWWMLAQQKEVGFSAGICKPWHFIHRYSLQNVFLSYKSAQVLIFMWNTKYHIIENKELAIKMTKEKKITVFLHRSIQEVQNNFQNLTCTGNHNNICSLNFSILQSEAEVKNVVLNVNAFCSPLQQPPYMQAFAVGQFLFHLYVAFLNWKVDSKYSIVLLVSMHITPTGTEGLEWKK